MLVGLVLIRERHNHVVQRQAEIPKQATSGGEAVGDIMRKKRRPELKPKRASGNNRKRHGGDRRRVTKLKIDNELIEISVVNERTFAGTTILSIEDEPRTV